MSSQVLEFFAVLYSVISSQVLELFAALCSVSSQVLELFVVLCSACVHVYMYLNARSALDYAGWKTGPVRPERTPGPNGTWNTAPSGLQWIPWTLIPVTVYVVIVVGAGLQRPPWMSVIALPDIDFGMTPEMATAWKNALRVLACVASIPLHHIQDVIFEHLGDQFHPIWVRIRSVYSIASEVDFLGGHTSVTSNRGSSRRVRMPGFVILSTRRSSTSLLSIDSVPTDTI